MTGQNILYAVITVDKNKNLNIFKTTNHAKMLDTVRQAAREQVQFKVLRQAVQQ